MPSKKYEETSLDVSSAWLVLSHGAWFSASINAASIAITTFAYQSKDRATGIGWSAVALSVQLWTFYAIYKTWLLSKKTPHFFGTEAFIGLALLNSIVMSITIWTLVIVCI
jgi:hypothetical protein